MSGPSQGLKIREGGGHVVLCGDNVPPLVEIGLADLPKSGGPPPRPPRLRRACMSDMIDKYGMSELFRAFNISGRSQITLTS